MSSGDQNKKTNKWSDPEYRRAYYREYHRKRNGGYKLHPYILEDGRRYKDVYEFPPEFESKEAYEEFKRERNKKYPKSQREVIYIPKPKIKCDICGIETKHGKFPAHLESVKHKQLAEILEKHGVQVN